MTNPRSARMRTITFQLFAWTLAWVLTLALATFGPAFLWAGNLPITLLSILINLAIGIGLILANIRHLKMLDEMVQRVHLEALALTAGVAMVFGLSYSLLDTTNVIPMDAEIGHLVGLLGLSYIGAVVWGLRRYR